MNRKELTADTTAQLDAWLTTHRQDGAFGSAATILPAEVNNRSLYSEFSANLPGVSAAPIEVGRTLAEGGMGVIKLAEQKALGRTVVVKTIRGEFAEHMAEQVLLEAWATGALEHPNIVPVHDIRVDEDGVPVIVLKRIEGESWTVFMHNKELVKEHFGATDLLEWNLDVLLQICQAIRFAHSKGILHRDLKPDNVMIGGFGEVYLVDWGIALGLRDDPRCPLPLAQHQTEMAGTPCYLAPEMLGNAPLDHRTDIYLLGAVLYEIFAGSPPHSTTNINNLVRDIQASSPTIPDSIPSLLGEICLRAMAATPNDRYQDASAFVNSLRDFQQSRGSQLLADEAEEQLRALTQQLQKETPDRHTIYQIFGAIRFGCETALETWPNNQKAEEQLKQSRLAMIKFELCENRPQAALSILSELSDPPTDLQGQVEKQLDAQRLEREELAKFRDDSNIALGSRTRTFVIVLFGFLWAGLPLVEFFSVSPSWLIRDDYPTKVYGSVILGGFTAFVWYWGRESLMKTEFNRRISKIVASSFPIQIILFWGGSALEMKHATSELLLMLLWGILTSVVTFMYEIRILPAVLGYFGGFVLACYIPQYRFLIMSGSHVVLTINCVCLWRRLMHLSRG